MSSNSGGGRKGARQAAQRIRNDFMRVHNAGFRRGTRPVQVSPHLPEHEKATDEDVAAYMSSRQVKTKSTSATT